MIGHTGFLVTARRLAPGTVLPEFKSRPSKTDFADEDISVWNPDHLGERQVGEKKLRKNLRNAAAAAENSAGRNDETA
jgi:tRNA (adenine57-N1/adenine58-N1)-methyltransferase